MSKTQFFFPPFRLDPVNAQLWRDDHEINLRRKTFDVLVYLVDHPNQLVTKRALLDAVWPEVTVSDSMPAVCVKELRKVLGDEAKISRFIETVHGRGYRFIARVTSDAPLEAARKPPAPATGNRPIMVGREDELARMRSWYSQVLEGQRKVVFIAGEAGIGKTAFVRAFLDSIEEEGGARFGRGQCIEQYGVGEPYMPVLEALTSLSQGAGGERTVKLLDRYAPSWLVQMSALLTPEQGARLQAQNRGVTQQRMLREIAQALEALAAETPLLLLLEDLHWSDFSTLEMISAIARRSEPARLLVVGTYRPVEALAHDHPLRAMKQELELHRYCEELRLRLLNGKNVEDYLARRVEGDGPQKFGMLATIVHAHTDGNPLFMVNMIDYLLADSGLLVHSREASERELAEALRTHRFDALRSVRQMIERNVERLNPQEQDVLEGASVVGVEFSAAAVAAALERPQFEVEACCARLSRREQLVSAQGPVAWPDGTIAASFRFHHSLYQEVLYDLLPRGRQAQLHRRIAEREEAGYGERAGEVATQLAHHYSRANDRDRTIHYLQIAAERAAECGAAVEAEDLYVRALKLLNELPQTVGRDHRELVIQVALGRALWGSRSWSHPEADRTFARARELAATLGENFSLVEASVTASALGSGQFKKAQQLGEQTLVMAERSGDRVSLCAAHTVLGQALLWRAQYVDAQKHLELGITYSKEGDPGEWGLDAHALAPIALLALGYCNRAHASMKEALSGAEHCTDPVMVGAVHMWAGMFFGMLRDARAIIEHAQALRSRAVKLPVWSGFSNLYMSKALMIQGESKEGLSYLRTAIVLNSAAGLVGLRPWEKLYEVELLAVQGQIADALALTDDLIAESEELAHLRSPALLHRAGLLADSKAKAPIAEAAYEAAIECARSQGAKYYELEATTQFARWLKSQERAGEARNLLATIFGWFTEGFDMLAIKEAEALLDELSSGPPVPPLRKHSGNHP